MYSVHNIIRPLSKSSHPVRIGWEALARSGPDDSCTPACFRTGSVWPKPDTVSQDLNQIRACFAQYYPGRLWNNGTESDSGETGSGPVAPCQKPGPVIPAHRLVSRPDVFGQTLTRPSRRDPGRFCYNMIHAFFGKTQLK